MGWIKIDVEVDEFLDGYTSREITEIINWINCSIYADQLRGYTDNEDCEKNLEDCLQDKSYTDKLTNEIILTLDDIRIQVDEDDLQNILRTLSKY